MLTTKQIADALWEMAPAELAESWDNVGLLVDCEAEVSSALCALDITRQTVQEAQMLGCELIISHHPVIFKGMKEINKSDIVFSLVQNGISAVCMHTNMDSAPGGVNDALAQIMGLEDIEAFLPFGRIGNLKEETNIEDLLEFCKTKFGDGIKYVNSGAKVKRLGVISGAGGGYIDDALAAGANCLLTGEAKHNEAIDALQKGVSLICAGHFATEKHISDVLAQRLAAMFPHVKFYASQKEKDPFVYLQ